ncbi:MAG: hypothetical protein SNJ72_08010 [Fimbriimonadales bacterium]
MNRVAEAMRQLIADSLIENYALGGASALAFYTEPVLTYDLDIFVLVRTDSQLMTMSPLYQRLTAMGYSTQGEVILIGEVPVQILVAYNPLVEEAVAHAKEMPFNGDTIRVITPEYLIAIALQTGRYKDRERVRLLLEQATIDISVLEDILKRHHLLDRWESIRRQME